MDRNSLIGFSLIGVILVGFYFLNKPNEEEIRRIQHERDSIAHVVQLEQKMREAQQAMNESPVQLGDTLSAESKYGELAPLLVGTEEIVTISNELIDVSVSTKGGRIKTVNLKEYLTHDKKPLLLFDGDESDFNFTFFTNSNRQVATGDFFFKVAENTTQADGSKQLVLASEMADGKAFEFVYTIAPESYKVDFNFRIKGIEQVLSRTQGAIDLEWRVKMRQNEKGADFERRYSGLYYKYFQDAVEDIAATKSGSEILTTRVKWIGYKDQFFSSVLIADEFFLSANVEQTKLEDQPGYLSEMTSTIAIPVQDDMKFSYYFGPNHYKTLKRTGHDLEEMINLGWIGFSWVNKWLVINVFNWLEKYISSYGLIIIILTLIIKLIIFPFTYKSYISTAKMRVLKPQIDEIQSKIPKEKAMERQQATMALYKKVGVSPLGGCLPMVLQFPILIAMFYFFPASIELRQESFLWATDLASYDSIYSWDTYIPILSNIYGNHISLFTLLMSLVNLFYTRINTEMTMSTQQMPGMKTMMYLMPIMFLFLFNNYSSGLSFYYFLSTLITVGQTFLIRRFVDEDALLEKLEANKKKVVKKSRFQEKLETIQKQQQARVREQAKRKK
jgi:YidC/Oxa1 family membrane protein insertase